MNKLSLAGMSLVAAIPGAVLAVLVIMAFVSSPGFENIAGMIKILAIVLMLASVSIALMPVGIFVFGNKAEEAATAEAGQPPGEKAAAATDESGESAVLDEEDFGEDDLAEDDFVEGEATAEAGDDFDAGDDEPDMFEAGDEEDFDLADFEDDEKA